MKSECNQFIIAKIQTQAWANQSNYHINCSVLIQALLGTVSKFPSPTKCFFSSKMVILPQKCYCQVNFQPIFGAKKFIRNRLRNGAYSLYIILVIGFFENVPLVVFRLQNINQVIANFLMITTHSIHNFNESVIRTNLSQCHVLICPFEYVNDILCYQYSCFSMPQRLGKSKRTKTSSVSPAMMI